MTNLHIRWMIRRDMPEVLGIENQSFEYPWSEEDFIRCLRQRNCIGMVAEFEEQVVGFMLYELHKTRFRLLNIAVDPGFRRQGVGRILLAKKISHLSHNRRDRILLEVRETNLDAQKFFRAIGFKAVSILRDFYNNWTTEDAYLMQYTYQPADAEEAMSVNRITRFVT